MTPRQLVRMMIRIYLFAIVIALCITAGKSFASENKDDPLQYHISKHCRAGCVDVGLFRMALQVSYQETRVDPLLMAAIIHVESKFVTKALNRTNGRSVGLAQIQVRWHPEKWVTTNHYDVFDNVRVGAMIYRDCAEKHRTRQKALWCYNGHQKRGMQTYVPKVLKVYDTLKTQGVRI